MLKKCKVVMLPTNEKAQIWKSLNGELYYEEQATGNLVKNANQHLYFLSDEEIKDNDHFMSAFYGYPLHNTQEWRVQQEAMLKKSSDVSNLKFHKIIATTDSSLNIEGIAPDGKTVAWRHSLPQPSQLFLEIFVKEYNKGNKIEEVLVEYEKDGYWMNLHEQRLNGPKPEFIHTGDKLKVNPKDNTITIKRVKDSWNREEVEALCWRAFVAEYPKMSPDDINDKVIPKFKNWIEQNL